MQYLYKYSDYFQETIGHLVDTETEVNLLDKIFKKHHVRTVLDVACGVGRHAIPLAGKGYVVTGIDYSPFQIRKAKANAKKLGGARFVVRDANDFSWPGRFDAAICMWTTLGEEPMQYRKVIRNVYKSLKSGGIFVIDNRSWEYIPKSRQETITNTVRAKDGTIIKTVIFDRYTDNFRIREVNSEVGGKKVRDLCVTYTLKEKDWVREMKEAGFRRFEIFHEYKARRVRKPKRLTIVAIK